MDNLIVNFDLAVLLNENKFNYKSSYRYDIDKYGNYELVEGHIVPHDHVDFCLPAPNDSELIEIIENIWGNYNISCDYNIEDKKWSVLFYTKDHQGMFGLCDENLANCLGRGWILLSKRHGIR